jgi:iron complex outermembrane receptor protein
VGLYAGTLPRAAVAADSDTAIETVLVTAQRRSENKQTVPIAVSSLSATALTDSGVQTLQDLSASVPGFVSTKSAGYGAAPLSIRGVGGANGGGNFFADEPVATYIDGVYIGRLSAATSDLVDVTSIQVLRGPQGTLYGRNSTAGAVVITTRRPTDTFQGYATTSVDQLGDYRGEAALSGPLVDGKLLGRIAGAYTDHGGFGRNVIDNTKVNDGRDITGRGSLRYLPSDTVTIDLIAEHFNQHFNPGLFRVAQVTGGAADSPYVLRPDFANAISHSQYAADTHVFNHLRNDSLSASLEWRGQLATLNFISGYRTFDVDGLADSDNTAPTDRTAPLVSYNSARLRNTQVTEELRLSSPDGSDGLNWIVGAYYMHERNKVNPFIISTSTAYFGLGTNAVFNAFQSTDAYAGFADASYEVLKGLTVHLGGRYSEESKDFNVTQLVTTILGGFSPAVGRVVPVGFAVAAPPPFTSNASFSRFTSRAVVDYKITTDVMAYASFSQGFKSGGFNAFGLVPAFKPETIDATEVGVKSQWLDHTLQINLDGFHYDYANLQVRQGVPTGGVSIVNVPGARVQGAELEALVEPITGFKLGANVTYLDAKFTNGSLQRVPLNAAFKFGANLPLETVNIAGNSLSRAPKWAIGANASYVMPVLTNKKLELGGNVRFQSNEFFSETQQTVATFRSGAWSETGLHATLSPTNDQWSVSLYGQNIFNDRHLTQVTPLSSFPYGTLNDPATVGVRASVNF